MSATRDPSVSVPRARRAKAAPDPVDAWFTERGWKPFPFQREVWDACGEGASGLLHATTGAGKTYAVWFGAMRHVMPAVATVRGAPPLSVVWLTPMRALAADTVRALDATLPGLAPSWTVGSRTGDTSSAERARQSKRLPTALVTTPESLSLLLTRADAQERLGSVRAVIVDEWHELMGNKRGVQVQLAIARLRRWNPALIVWGLSATLGNLEEARDVLLGPASTGRLVQGKVAKRIEIDTLIPKTIERFPWAGHLGVRQRDAVVREIDAAGTSLLFTNTRSQAELWYQALLEARPDWAGLIALHHGSLDRGLRDWVEAGLKAGTLKACVCTSSLDLGVDFLPVERVLQLGSPKGVARLTQRAGRSGHAPGRVSRVTCIPTHALELVEAAAARRASQAGRIESRRPPLKPMDVLIQHLVTVALGGGFVAGDLLAEIRTTHAYREISDDEWRWVLAFVVHGGSTLGAYPEYHRVVPDDSGVHGVPDAQIAKRHRMGIGTIVSDASMEVKWFSGGRIGHVEESFIAMMKPGDCFFFAGRRLELVRVHEMSALVRKATSDKGAVPRWQGGKMPLSSELAEAVVGILDAAAEGRVDDPEVAALAPLFEIQQRWSHLPGSRALVVETVKTREGHHFFCFPFGGRHVHTGLANLVAWRIARETPTTFSMCVNDYGFELLSPVPVDWDAAIAGGLFSADRLLEDILDSLNAGQLARGRFREIARVAGLVFQGFPGQPKSTRQLQASSELFFDVFRKYDPDNLLLRQAQREVLEQELELTRMERVLAGIAARPVTIVQPPYPTPFAFPLMIERIREKLSTEKVGDRVQRMLAEMERRAGA